MTAEGYARLTRPLRARPRLLRLVVGLNRGLTYAGYALYPLLLVLVGFADASSLCWFVLVPGVSFALLSLVRARINAPRPYEVLDIEPLIHKDTRGKSFPSRHVFSIFVIAMAWLAFVPPVGAVLLVLSVLMAVLRVVGGVHWPRDVVAGALCGMAAGAILLLL